MLGLERKGIVGSSNALSVELIAPYWMLRTKAQTVETTITGTIEGKKKIARNTERAKILVLSKTAMRKAEATPVGALSTTHQIVFLITRKKSSSVSRFV